MKIIRVVFLTLFAFAFAYKLYWAYHDSFFLDGVFLFLIAFIGSVILWSVIRSDIKSYKNSRKLISYWSSLLGVIFLLADISFFFFLEYKVAVPTLIYGATPPDFNSFSVDFKIDGTYVMENGTGLGQNYFYGTYSLRDSIIILDKSNIDNCIRTNRLAIRRDTTFTKYHYGRDLCIVQLDKNNKVIDKDSPFIVRIDNRHK